MGHFEFKIKHFSKTLLILCVCIKCAVLDICKQNNAPPSVTIRLCLHLQYTQRLKNNILTLHP